MYFLIYTGAIRAWLLFPQRAQARGFLPIELQVLFQRAEIAAPGGNASEWQEFPETNSQRTSEEARDGADEGVVFPSSRDFHDEVNMIEGHGKAINADIESLALAMKERFDLAAVAEEIPVRFQHEVERFFP
jgi:hypothetical protein